MPVSRDVFFAVTHDGCDSRFYVDSELKNKAKMDYDFTCSDGIDVGFYELTKGEFFMGKINYLEVYSDALTHNQIAERMLRGTPEASEDEDL